MFSSDFHYKENYGFWLIAVHPGVILVFMKAGSLRSPACPVGHGCTGMTRNPSFSSLKCCLQSNYAINKREIIHACVRRFKVTSCKLASLKSTRFSQKKKDRFFSNRAVCAKCFSLKQTSLHRQTREFSFS